MWQKERIAGPKSFCHGTRGQAQGQQNDPTFLFGTEAFASAACACTASSVSTGALALWRSFFNLSTDTCLFCLEEAMYLGTSDMQMYSR